MQCYIYRSRRQAHTYLFVPHRDDFSKVPVPLLNLFGEAEFSFAFELSAESKLVQAQASEVLRNLHENGFFLQLPPSDESKRYKH